MLLDLDGTLTDSGPGIKRCVLYALQQMGHEAPHYDTLDHCVGPPLVDSFARLLPEPESSDKAQIDRAIDLYRERYNPVGAFENRVYDGVPEALAELRAAGLTLYLCTSKPWVSAQRICRHFGLADHLVAMHGAELDGTRNDKTSLIAYVLETEGLDPAHTLMVGDRHHDIVGAKANGLGTVGVLWGYGDEAEHRAAGTDRVIAHPRELAGACRA